MTEEKKEQSSSQYLVKQENLPPNIDIPDQTLKAYATTRARKYH